MKIMPEKITTFISYCTSATLVCGGGILQWLHGLDWNQVAVVGGFVIGAITAVMNFYFKNRQTKAYEKALKAGYVTPPPAED
ncbi:phage holin [Serratia sp. PAMC26656]|uniref:phage holin n=1 Tax=Serratia sp. PAMC26656 TaxID=2775909 RepID=UPI000F82AC95|nr:phage holin [Serratia sp. PAMC26656]MBJ7889436.1 class II holin family protein [Serratia sp. PAMC26656]